jgi:hypothetical protein
MKATRIVRWESTLDARRCGIEVTGVSAGEARLAAELDRALGRWGALRPAFVLAGFRAGRPNEVAAAIAGASDLFFNARVCVAVDQETLLAIDPALLCGKNLGIVLDHVNANTPLSALSAEIVDAVRFEDSFVERASTDLRSSCVIDAMLKLAHDLGLATLASTSPAKNNWGFDYVLSPPASK